MIARLSIISVEDISIGSYALMYNYEGRHECNALVSVTTFIDLNEVMHKVLEDDRSWHVTSLHH